MGLLMLTCTHTVPPILGLQLLPLELHALAVQHVPAHLTQLSLHAHMHQGRREIQAVNGLVGGMTGMMVPQGRRSTCRALALGTR